MKDRDRIKVDTLKSLLARFSNNEAVRPPDLSSTESQIAGANKGVGSTEVSRKVLSLSDREEIIRDEIQEIQQVVNQLSQPSDYRADLEQRLLVLQEYLQ
jgi:hypothetical protein